MSKFKPRIKSKSIKETDWINNFWFIDDYLYVTDSSFDNGKKNLLGRINVDDLITGVKDKKTPEKKFLISPNPLSSDPITSQKSNIEQIGYYEGFVYNVFKFHEALYISVINSDDESYVIEMKDGKSKQIKEYDNYLVVGELNDKLVLKSVKTRETFIDGVETKPRQIKRICYTESNYIILNDLSHLYSLKKGSDELKTIKDNDKEINICNFDKSSFVISDKESSSTYLINKNNQREDIYKNYFYRLDCYNKILLIGKPLFIGDDVESYTLPLVFVD